MALSAPQTRHVPSRALYQKLRPRRNGPSREEVAANQRSRLHGATIEGIAASGYADTSVAELCRLAGVSKKTFYEQFAGKETCFLTTFDLILVKAVKRVNIAYQSSSASREGHMRMVFEVFVDELQTNFKAAHLVIVDALTAGPQVLGRLDEIEGLIASVLSKCLSSPQGGLTSTPISRAVVGGLFGSAFMRLCGDEVDLSGLAEEMLQWSAGFQSPAVGFLEVRPCISRSLTTQDAMLTPVALGVGRRGAVLRVTLDLVLGEGYEQVCIARIAGEAGLLIYDLPESLQTVDKCFMAVMDAIAEDLIEVLTGPDLVSHDWASAVCHRTEKLLNYVSVNRAYARILVTDPLKAGSVAIEKTMLLWCEIVTVLIKDAPTTCSITMVPAIAGALWKTIHRQAARGYTHLLPSLSEHLSYTVLTPLIGADMALEAIIACRA
jgi:AcrR family transcriptional regulator